MLAPRLVIAGHDGTGQGDCSRDATTGSHGVQRQLTGITFIPDRMGTARQSTTRGVTCPIPCTALPGAPPSCPSPPASSRSPRRHSPWSHPARPARTCRPPRHRSHPSTPTSRSRRPPSRDRSPPVSWPRKPRRSAHVAGRSPTRSRWTSPTAPASATCPPEVLPTSLRSPSKRPPRTPSRR
ncbi:hypothetical protein DPM12_20265 [Phytoactinopolyspora halophila]|uniref:Uncharacterized protein n=1 Tax=Phytoactinopolyspora halophila TaxID=1981511 RepID=A0A329QBR9_9ACTN|nr:hypothetical protein DPM12_20265 [Phytoactinopolyspora halophila]